MGKDCGHTVPCGCEDRGLFTPPPCGAGVECPDSNPCSETFDAGCIFYTGAPLVCGTDEVVTTNTSLADAVAAVITYFCTQDSVGADIICGEDRVVPAGTSVNDALDLIVTYFCDRIVGLEKIVGNNTTALLNTVQATSITVPDPAEPLCSDTTTTLTFRDNGNNVITTVQFVTRTCEPRDLCAVAISEPTIDSLSFPVCTGDTLTRILYSYLRDQLATDLTPGLFSQTANSTPVQGITNAGGSLFSPTGAGNLTVPAFTFEVGDAYKLDCAGHLTHPSPPTANELRVEILFNGIVQLTIDMDMPVITDLHWNMEINFAIRSTGVSGQVMTAVKFMHEEDANDKLSAHGLTQLSTLNTEVINTLDIRATWGTSADDREIYSEIMNLHKIY